LTVLLLAVGAPAARADAVRDLDLQFGAGYRHDRLDWNIAGTPQGTNPNVLSELSWDGLAIYQARAKGKLVVESDKFPYFDTCLKGSIGYGWIVDGRNQDSDFAGDNRTLEFSRSRNNADDGSVFDVSLALGPRFRVREERLTITPLVGLSYHEQNLILTDGVQTISDQAAADAFFGPGELMLQPLGPFPGLDSSYETRWKGPWVGVDLEIRPSDRLTLAASAEYHWADYEATADWNLRADFAHPASFTHQARGEGILLSAAADLALAERWSVELSYDFADWQADDGTDRVLFADGSVGVTRLNEVNWRSQAVLLGVTYRFF
jgi:hypothetical protein